MARRDEARKPRDDRWETLKRRVRLLARLDGEPVWLIAEGPALHLARISRTPNEPAVRDAALLVEATTGLGTSVGSAQRGLSLAEAPVRLTAELLAAAHRDVRAIANAASLALAREHHRSLARFGTVDAAWVAAKAAQLDDLQARLATATVEGLDAFDHVLALVQLAHGRTARQLVEALAVRLEREPSSRRLPGAKVARTEKTWLRSLALLALAFPLGDDGMPFQSLADLEAVAATPERVKEIAVDGITLAAAVTLLGLPLHGTQARRVAQWVSEGLPLPLVVRASEDGNLAELLGCANARAAQAYATWTGRLLPHYRSLGVDFELSPELFTHLPKNEDAAMLAVCLMDEALPRTTNKRGAGAAETRDPIAVLDATLGLFERLPSKAKGLLGRLRGTTAGAGRASFPEMAAWLDDDTLLDRYVHLTRLCERPLMLSKAVREDFDHAAKAARERDHLRSLPARDARQEARLATLVATERTREGSPRQRTKRRLAERIETLLGVAYRHELDATFREIMREAWGIAIPRMTPAWRDVVRFWLVVDDNRELLSRLLRAASESPGRDVKQSFPRNTAWIARASRTLDVKAWLAPRHAAVEAVGQRYTLALEEDPLEVLRMGVPFGTCLSLEDGFNAASTVLNAIEANKRVLYVRGPDGKVVARQLLALSEEHTLLGYHLYVATRGAEQEPIQQAMRALVEQLADDVGAPLGEVGAPEQLHEGFWYDDGTVAWSKDVDAVVTAYCVELGLTPPATPFEDLVTEARGHAAMERGDLEGARAALVTWNEGLVNVALGQWVVDRLGERRATRLAATDAALVGPLLRSLAARGETGVARAIEVATRLPEERATTALQQLLVEHPPSVRIADALVELAVRAARSPLRSPRFDLGDLAAEQLAPFLDGVENAFDQIDRAEPAWASLAARKPRSAKTFDDARNALIRAVVAAYEREPDPGAVVACLASRRRSSLAHHAALAVAERVLLTGGTRALARLRVLRPELAPSDALRRAVAVQAGESPEEPAAEAASPPLTAAFVVAHWQDPARRSALVQRLATATGEYWWRFVAAAERVALQASEVETTAGLFEALVRAMVEADQMDSLALTGSLAQLRAVLRLVVTTAPPERAVELYKALLDERAASLFLAQVKKQPRDRAAALRAAASKLRFHGPEQEARKAWLLGTRPLKKRRASSIERQ